MRDQISTTISDVSKSVSENYTDTNDRMLQAVVENSRKAVDFAVKTADQVNDQMPEFDLPFEVPFADRVPTATEAGDRYMELVERVVEMNRDYSERMVKLNREYTDRIVKLLADEPARKPAPKPAAKKTTKKTAKKAATTKATTTK